MKRDTWIALALGGVVLLADVTLRAQEEPAPPPPMLMLQGGMPGEEGPETAAVGFGERIELLGFGGLHGGKIVKNAPFTATATSETNQTLVDGNRISRKTQTNLYRDGQGRFRKEVTMPAIGPLAASGHARSFVVISDPVAGASYVLEPDDKIARKLPDFRGKWRDRAGKPGNGERERGLRTFKEKMDQNVQTESLGTQNINGVNAEGTRYTRTIPAGQIGNDKPINVVSERWYSPDLQMVVMSKHSDPRFGDTTYTVTNIQRQEPPASLFSVPSDYTVQQGPGPKRGMRRFRGEPPPDAPAPPPPGN
jgi:hypothetical protein